MLLVTVVALVLIVSIGLGAFLYRSPRLPPEFEQRYLIAFLPFGYTLLLTILLTMVGRMPFWDWNAARLAPSVAMRYGYNPYAGKDSGPINGNVYGPVSALVFLPAALAPDPTSAILLAGVISLLLMVLPIVLLQLAMGIGHDSYKRVTRLTSVLFGVSLLLVFPGIEYAVGSIHADSPAMGFGLLACIVAIGAARHPSRLRLLACATLTALACYAKQIEVPLGVALFVYLGLSQSWAYAMKFLAYLLAIGVALGLAFGFLFGLPEMYLNMVRVPSAHPWKRPALGALAQSALVTGLSGSLLILILLPFCLFLWQDLIRRGSESGSGASEDTVGGPGSVLAQGQATSKERGGEAGGLLAEQGWPCLMLAAIAMLPTSVLGGVKVGGGLNSNHCLYYLAACASFVIFQWSAQVEPALRRAAMLTCYLLTAVVLGLSAKDIVDLQWFTILSKNPQQEAYRFARQHPGEAYFPWNPLSTLMAEGKLYHFEYGVFDRYLANVPPNNLRRFVPPHAKYVMFHRRSQSRDMLKYLPEFSRSYWVADLHHEPLRAEPVDVHNLVGWYVYEKEASGSLHSPVVPRP
jgi:hypothetical protein